MATDAGAADSRTVLAPAPRAATKPRVRKLRLLLILIGFGMLAVVSTVFGMLMAVASDLPQLENAAQYTLGAANSYLYDDHWRPIGMLRAAEPRGDRHLAGDLTVRCCRRSCGRGQALLDRPGSRPARASRARRSSDVTGGSEAGRLDDRRAVRQERARRAGQPDDLREAARGRAGLPADAQVAEARDPDPVPEHDLLRGRRLRDRVGGAGLLRQGPRLQPVESPTRPGAAAADAATEPSVCIGARPTGRRRCSPGWSPTRRAFDPVVHPEPRLGTPQPGAQGHAPAALHHRRAVRVRDQRSRSRPRR